jgi:transcriptional regulator with XRE-family HTH domain
MTNETRDVDKLYIRTKITQLRERKDVSARQMSLDFGKGVNYIHQIEAGYSLPPIIELLAICRYLGVSVIEFFDTENDRPKAFDDMLNTYKSGKEPLLSANFE